jgi:hypothetical protein
MEDFEYSVVKQEATVIEITTTEAAEWVESGDTTAEWVESGDTTAEFWEALEAARVTAHIEGRPQFVLIRIAR